MPARPATSTADGAQVSAASARPLSAFASCHLPSSWSAVDATLLRPESIEKIDPPQSGRTRVRMQGETQRAAQ